MVMLDLEDAVAPDAKASAREQVVQALLTLPYEGKVRGVRVNAVDTGWCADDIRHVVEGAGERIECLVLPKVEDAGQVHFAHHLLNQLELKLGLGRRIGVELQIETARGLENVAGIAGASDRAETLVFGPIDFAADLRVPGLTPGAPHPDRPGDFWQHFMLRILVAARAHGLQAIDGPFVQVRDLAGLEAAGRRVAALGYDGKWALNPAQAELLNGVFSPSQADFDRAKAMVAAHKGAHEQGTGAVMLDGEMIDEATRKLAAVTVERGRLAGMEAGP